MLFKFGRWKFLLVPVSVCAKTRASSEGGGVSAFVSEFSEKKKHNSKKEKMYKLLILKIKMMCSILNTIGDH